MEQKISLSGYEEKDCQEIANLFYDTVHTATTKEYNEEQRNAWATGKVDLDQWNQSFLKHDTLVANVGDMIVGFADMDESGYLDRLYVHKDYQRSGIATLLCDALEANAKKQGITKVTTHASMTAKPFFMKRGYVVKKKQEVIRVGVLLTNYVMEGNLLC